MQRLYGTAFFTKKDLDDYVHQVEEAKKRDPRVLGTIAPCPGRHPYAGMNGLREGQKISFELVADKRSGKMSADKLQAV